MKFLSVVSGDGGSEGLSAKDGTGARFSRALSSSPTRGVVECHQSLLAGKDLSAGST